MTDRRQMDGATWFASITVALAGVALLASAAVAFGVFSGSDDRGGQTADAADSDAAAGDARRSESVRPADASVRADVVIQQSAAAMAAVTSVEFTLDRTGAPIFIDEFERISLDSLLGQFSVPNQAQAELTVTVNDNLTTKLGAIALDDEVWLSNPVTGDFETLPEGYDIDPSRFFDPENGWQPLLANLTDVELLGLADRGGERYRLRGVAPAAEVRNITVGLVRDQDVPVDLWIDPATSLVSAVEFTTTLGSGDAEWVLELDRYGETFTIEPPDNVRQT